MSHVRVVWRCGNCTTRLSTEIDDDRLDSPIGETLPFGWLRRVNRSALLADTVMCPACQTPDTRRWTAQERERAGL